MHLLTLAAMLIPSLWPPVSSPGSADLSAVEYKGIRAIIADGSMLTRRALVHDTEVATSIYNGLVQAFLRGERYDAAQLEGRPCIALASFLYSNRTAHISVDNLRPQDADFIYWLYPAVGDRPAVLFSGYAVRLPERQLAELSANGIPVVAPSGASSCHAPPP